MLDKVLITNRTSECIFVGHQILGVVFHPILGKRLPTSKDRVSSDILRLYTEKEKFAWIGKPSRSGGLLKI